MAKHSANILEWARQGAEARWQQLQAELASLVEAFPHLTGATKGGRAARRASVAGADTITKGSGRRGRATAAPAGDAQRKRSKMTAAQKKAVSLRMKKYWADRRKAAGKA